MATLQVINGSDSGAQAIQKMDNNIKEVNLELGSDISDDRIGSRTINQATATVFSNTGKITQIFSWVAKMIKAITGKTNWYDTPVKSIESLNNEISILSANVGNKAQLQTIVKTDLVSAINEVKNSGGGSTVAVVNNLTSTSTTDALSANQGKVLNENKANLASPNFTGTPTIVSKTIATTEKIDILPYLVNGWVQHFGVIEINKVGSLCSLAFVVKDGVVTQNTNIFANLPTSVRPTSSRVILAYSATDKMHYQVVIDNAGAIRISSVNNLPTGQIVFSLSYTI